MQMKENYKLIKIAPLEINSVLIKDLNDFIEVFNNSNEKFIYRERLKEKISFTEIFYREKEDTYHFYFFKEGICYEFNAAGYEILEDLLDARKYELKAVLKELLSAEEIENEKYFYPVYYSFKNSPYYPDYDYWQTIRKYGFGLQNWNQCWPESLSENEKKLVLKKGDYEEAKQAGFLKYEKESGVKWLDANRIGILNLEDYELFVSISKLFYGIDQYNYRRQRELLKAEFDEIKALGFDRNDLEEVLKSKFLETDTSDYYNRNKKLLTLNSIKGYMKWKEEDIRAKNLGFESHKVYCEADKLGIDDPQFYLEYKNSGLEISAFRSKKYEEIIIPSLVRKKTDIFTSAWNDALEKFNAKDWEGFIFKAFSAMENGIDAILMWESKIQVIDYEKKFKADSPNQKALTIDDKIDYLKERGYSFPERKEFTYIRRLRNNITHDNEKIDDKEAKSANLFFKEVIRGIKKLDFSNINPLSETEISELKTKLEALKV